MTVREKILGVYFMTYVVQQRKMYVSDDDRSEVRKEGRGRERGE